MSTMDARYEHLQAPTNHLDVTVQAPAAALSGHDGQIRASGMDGLFVSDVRVLTEARLRFSGFEPHHLARLREGPGRTRYVGVAHGFGDPINDPTIRIERIRQVAPDGMSEEIRIVSTARRTVRAEVTLDLRCDLTPLELAKESRAPRPEVTATVDTGLTWSRDGITVHASGAHADLTATPAQLRWDVELAPRTERRLSWKVRVVDSDPTLAAPAGPVEWTRPRVRCDDTRVERLVTQSLDDLESLRLTDSLGGTFLGAGAPWFLTLFGRDSIWAARMLLPLGTELAEGTLRTLSRRQGTSIDPMSGEAPGKIMHELRNDDPRLDRRVQTPDGHMSATYYGTVDATLLWISLLAEAWRWGLPDTTVVSLLPHLNRALDWLEHHGDPDGDGFVEYIDAAGRGLANQGWKDSFDAVQFHDGTMARPPIALCEVQAYAHRATLDAAELLDAFGSSLDGATAGRAEWCRAYAARLNEAFRARYWVEGPLGPFPALAIDGDGRPVDSLTSNIGHLLGTGLLTADEEATVARLLAAPPLSDAYGLRTMSTLDSGYSPLSYHCGTVWPHDTAIALLGLASSGASAAASNLIAGLLGAAETFEFRLPELYGGFARAEVAHAVPYPGACRPQAWAAAAAVSVLQAALGLSVNVPRGEVTVRPSAGVGLGALSVHGLRVAGQSIDIDISRDAEVQVVGLPPYLRLSDTAPVPLSADA